MPRTETINQKTSLTNRIMRFGKKTILHEKLNNWLGYTLVFSLAIFIGYLMAFKPILGLGFTGLSFGFAIVLVCILNAEAGLYINMIYSFLISHFNRLLFDDTLQVGVISDILVGATFLGFLVRNINLKNSFSQFTQTSVVALLLLVYSYTAIEVFNPNGSSLTGWFPAFRKILGTLLLLFISFNVLTNKERIIRFIRVLFFLCLTTAIYACIQQWHGFFQFELNWLQADEKRFRMTYVNGGARKMSFMPDALSLSIIMAICSVFFIGIASSLKKYSEKLIVYFGVLLMILAMSYSLTRTANVMFVGGLALFILITLDKKKTRIFAVLAVIFFILILYGPYNNSQIGQFRQTFKGGTKDASYKVREDNRKAIQPYIYSHPMGGGLSTTGGEGLIYNPGHRLAGFPPDSGYLKKALELGWIGLILFLFLYFTVLKTGIHGYFTSKNEEIKILYASSTATCFSLYIGDFSQVAIGQITDIVVYYPLIALLLRLKTINQ